MHRSCLAVPTNSPELKIFVIFSLVIHFNICTSVFYDLTHDIHVRVSPRIMSSVTKVIGQIFWAIVIIWFSPLMVRLPVAVARNLIQILTLVIVLAILALHSNLSQYRPLHWKHWQQYGNQIYIPMFEAWLPTYQLFESRAVPSKV